MSYLLDKKNQRKKFLSAAALLFFVLALFYFRAPIFKTLALASHTVFRPAFVLKNNIASFFSASGAAFRSKKTLQDENEALKIKLLEKDALLLGYDALLDENNQLKDILGRKGPARNAFSIADAGGEKANMIISAILSKPGQSPYDTLIIDAGLAQGAKEGALVFAQSNVPIGRINTAYSNSSKVVLFSSSGERTQVSVAGVGAHMELLGRGGGNFEIILPRDFNIEKDSTVTWPGSFPYVVAIVKTIISDPRDAATSALLTTPVNIQELKFVEILK